MMLDYDWSFVSLTNRPTHCLRLNIFLMHLSCLYVLLSRGMVLDDDLISHDNSAYFTAFPVFIQLHGPFL